MEEPKLSVQDFAAKIKAKYPDYKDIPDEELAAKVIAKHPEYESQVNTKKNFDSESIATEQEITSEPSVANSSPESQNGQTLSHFNKMLPYLKEQAAESFANDPRFQSKTFRDAYYKATAKNYTGRDYFKVLSTLMEVDPYAKKEAQGALASQFNPIGETIPTAVEAAATGIKVGVEQGAKTKEITMTEGIGSGILNAGVATGKTLLGAASAVVPELAAFNIASQGLEETAPEAASWMSPAHKGMEVIYGDMMPKWAENTAAVADFVANLVAFGGAYFAGKKLSPVEVIKESSPDNLEKARQQTEVKFTPHPDEVKASDIENDIAKNPERPVNGVLQEQAGQLRKGVVAEKHNNIIKEAEVETLKSNRDELQSQMTDLSDASKEVLQPALEEVNGKIKTMSDDLKTGDTVEMDVKPKEEVSEIKSMQEKYPDAIIFNKNKSGVTVHGKDEVIDALGIKKSFPKSELEDNLKTAIRNGVKAIESNIDLEASEKPKGFNFSAGKTSMEKYQKNPIEFSTEEEADRFILENSENPKEIAETYVRSQNVPNEKGYKEQVIAENLGKIKREGFLEWGDKNAITQTMARKYFSKDGRHIDDLALEMSDMAGIKITPEDIADYIRDEDTQRLTAPKETSFQQKLKNKFQELTGLPLTNKNLKLALSHEAQKSEPRLVEGEKISDTTSEIPQGEGGEKTAEATGEEIKPPAPPDSVQEVAILESQQGKKSLLGRVHEGTTPEEIKTSVEKHGLNYDIETHPEAERIANNFIQDVGIENALKAVKNGEVKGGSVPFVWATAIDAVHKEYLAEKNPELKAKLLEKESALIDAFDTEMRKSGQTIAALHPAYQISDLGYKIGSILNRAKEANAGEAVPEILKNKLIDLSEKLDTVSQKLAESEKRQTEYSEAGVLDAVEKELNKFYEKMPSERRKIADKVIAALDELEAELSGKAFASIIPIPVVKLAIRTIKIAIKGGVSLTDAIQLGIEKIKEKHKDFDEGKFKDFADKWFKDRSLEFKGGKSDLEKYQSNLKKAIGEYERRLREKDFAPRKKGEPLTLDEETFQLKVEKNKLKDQVDLEIEKLKLRNRPLGEKIQSEFVDILNLPKSLVASADMSAPLRQGAVLSAAHPIIASKATVEMFRQAFSEKRANDWLARLKSTPEYATMKESGLYFAEPTAKLSAKEEQFISNIAHKIPIWGKIVKGSERAYTGFLNKLRADVFAQFHDTLIQDGFQGEQLKKELKSFADFVNNASGRGNLGRFEESTAVLNASFFSPRYAISRFNLLNPMKYIKMSPRARAEALKTVGTYVGVGAMTLALAKAGGAQVNTDPRSSDFGKIKIGNTRFDIWAGFQQWVRLATQLATGEKTTLDGKVQKLGQGYKTDTRLDIAERFVRTKFSPSLGFAADVLASKNVVGQPVDFKFHDLSSFVNSKEGQLIVPLWLQDLRDAADDAGAGRASSVGLASFFGVGTSTYVPNESSSRSRSRNESRPVR